jgi:hypothetical protein
MNTSSLDLSQLNLLLFSSKIPIQQSEGACTIVYRSIKKDLNSRFMNMLRVHNLTGTHILVKTRTLSLGWQVNPSQEDWGARVPIQGLNTYVIKT